MSPLRIYSSVPLRLEVAAALLGLKPQAVQLLPLSALPAPLAVPRRPALHWEEYACLCQRLAAIGDALSAHEAGALRLGAGEEQGLLAERDALLARKRAAERRLRPQVAGGPPC